MTPLAYRASCVPIAIAAILDLDVDAIAGLLWRAGAARRTAAPGGDGYGTSLDVAGDVLTRLGCRVQEWRSDGQLWLDAEDTVHYLAARAHHAVMEIVYDRTRSSPAEPRRLPGDSEPGPALSVAAWRSRFPCGRWLLVVRRATRRTRSPSSHALALVDGEILAGGTHHREHQVEMAFRILNRS